jgi:hypothetical protein
MNRQKVFSYSFWKEYQGEAGEKFEGVKIEGNNTYAIFRKTPEQDIYHISIVILGKNFDIIYKRGSKEGSIQKRRQRW